MTTRHIFVVFGIMFALTGLGFAQAPPDRANFEKIYPVEDLAHTMGRLHYISFNCDAQNAQTWRETMLELLEHEAPARGNYRQHLAQAFNDGFNRQSDARLPCGDQTEKIRQRLAQRGHALSEQIRRNYIE